VVLMASSSAFARKASHHHSKPAAAIKQQSATKTDPGGVARHPDDVALDRKTGVFAGDAKRSAARCALCLG
jgi:hypothetical protein